MGGGGVEVFEVDEVEEYAVGEFDAVWVFGRGGELCVVCEGGGGAVGGEVVVWVRGVVVEALKV